MSTEQVTSYPPIGSTLCVSVETMAQSLGVSKQHAYKVLDEGLIESRYLGRRRLVLWTDLCDFMRGLPADRS